MFIIAGQRNCGRVDDVPGTCYVVTRFMHLYYVPLIPLSSWLVPYNSAKKSEKDWQRIRLSAKSVIMGWLQGFLVLFGFMELGWGILCLSGPRGADLHDLLSLMLGTASLVVLLLLRIRPLRADHERANQLRTQLGLDVKVQEERFDFPSD